MSSTDKRHRIRILQPREAMWSGAATAKISGDGVGAEYSSGGGYVVGSKYKKSTLQGNVRDKTSASVAIVAVAYNIQVK